MTVTLPQQFQDTMRELLAEEYQDYIKSMEEPSHTALRMLIRTALFLASGHRKQVSYATVLTHWSPGITTRAWFM